MGFDLYQQLLMELDRDLWYKKTCSLKYVDVMCYDQIEIIERYALLLVVRLPRVGGEHRERLLKC